MVGVALWRRVRRSSLEPIVRPCPAQVLGEWQVKNEGLRPYHRLAQQLARRFHSFEAQQVGLLGRLVLKAAHRGRDAVLAGCLSQAGLHV